MDYTQVRKLWTAALLSGEYVQGNGQLRYTVDGVSYDCCLGVLCDLHTKHFGTEWVYEDGSQAADDQPPFDGKTDTYRHMDQAGIPDGHVLAWAGIDRDNAAGLASSNDAGFTFKEIAAYITDENWDGGPL